MSTAPDAERLRAIIAVASEIAATRLDLGSVMRLVAERAAALTGAETGAVELIEGEASPGRAADGGGEPLDASVRSVICVALHHGEQTVGVLKVMSPEPQAFDEGDVATLGLLADLVASHLATATALAQARCEDYEDALSGLPGRPAFNRALRGEVARASRYGLRLSLALLDIDRLARLNQLHGRQAGDQVLMRVGAALRAVRAGDMAFRLADDDFALLLPNTPYHAARTAAQRAGAGIGSCGLPAGHVTVSVGVAEARSADPPGLLASAQGALARAKQRRRGLHAA
jgi:diguanylate cyclase (GGDEF)-like protein